MVRLFSPLSLAAILPRQDLPRLGLVWIFHRQIMSMAVVESSLGDGRLRVSVGASELVRFGGMD